MNYSDLSDPSNGAIRLSTTSSQSRIYFAANSRASVQLEINSIISLDDKDVVVIHSTEPVSRMARSPRAAPGRTGHSGLRCVGMAELLHDSDGISDLRDRFREQAAL